MIWQVMPEWEALRLKAEAMRIERAELNILFTFYKNRHSKLMARLDSARTEEDKNLVKRSLVEMVDEWQKTVERLNQIESERQQMRQVAIEFVDNLPKDQVKAFLNNAPKGYYELHHELGRTR